MTWAATVLVLMAGGVWVFEFVKGRKERSRAGEQAQGKYQYEQEMVNA